MFNFNMLPSDVLENIYMFASTSKDHFSKFVLPLIATIKTVTNGCEGCYIADIANLQYCSNCSYGMAANVGPKRFNLLSISEDRYAYRLVRTLKDHDKIILALNDAEYHQSLMYELSCGPLCWTDRVRDEIESPY